MSSAAFALIVNTIVALLFAGTFCFLAIFAPSFRRIHWFAASYLAGSLTPASELLVRFSPWPKLFVLTSFASFLIAFYLTAVAICRLYRRPIPWPQLAFLFTTSLLTRLAIWEGQRNTLLFEFTYQLPFAIAMLVCAILTIEGAPRGKLNGLLGGLFIVSAAQFLFKPFIAIKVGSGASAQDYISSLYALFSQSGTGVLLTSIGLTLILIVVRKMIREVQQVANEDALSSLLNRRGFHATSQITLSTARARDERVALFMFDLDHFKQLNDNFGHHVGDWFISAFAETLRLCFPPGAAVARLGGEEFAALVVPEDHHASHEIGESVRRHLQHLSYDLHPDVRVTVSIGLVIAPPDAGMTEMLRRADAALYQAKASGRDRICVDRVNSAPRIVSGMLEKPTLS